MYRPTVRYADCYQQYVDKMFLSTHLDRNQIIRAALFTAAHSQEFLHFMNQNKKGDVPLPSPLWQLDEMELWREQAPKKTGERKDVKDVNDRERKTETNSRIIESRTKPTTIHKRHSTFQGPERTVSEGVQTSGIKIRIG